MTIDGTNISTFGLKLLKVSDQLGLARRKQILNEQQFNAGDIRYSEFDVLFELKGKYASLSELGTSVNNFMDHLKLNTVHQFVEPARGLNFQGVVKNGFSCEIYKKVVIIKLNVTITAWASGSLTI